MARQLSASYRKNQDLIKIALAQYLSGGEVGEIVGEARAGGAEIVVFPERYSNGYAPFRKARREERFRWQT